MDKYREIEKKWLRYKIKSYLKIFLFSFVVLIVIVAIVDFVFINIFIKGENQSEKIAVLKNEATTLTNHKTIQDASLGISEKGNSEKSKNSEKIFVENQSGGEECFIINVDKLHVRLLPNSNSRIVGYLHLGDNICIMEKRDGWVKFDKGWSYANGTMETVKGFPEKENEQIPIEEMITFKNQNITKSQDIVIDKKETITNIDKKRTNEEAEENMLILKKEQITQEDMLENLKSRFNTEKKYSYAVEIADIYYKNGNIKNAEKWALVANGIDNEAPESWMVFAKIKYKEGFKREAISILERYQSRRYSKEVKNLLAQITNESLR